MSPPFDTIKISAIVLLLFLKCPAATTVACNVKSGSVTTFEPSSVEPVFLVSAGYPNSAGNNFTCYFRSATLVDGDTKPMALYFTHASFDFVYYTETAYDDLGLTYSNVLVSDDVDTSNNEVFNYGTSLVRNLEVLLQFYHRRNSSWSGFQAMAIVAGNRSDCPLSGGSYVFDATDPDKRYFIASSFLIHQGSEKLDQRPCSWQFDAHNGYSIKVVIPALKLFGLETLTFKSSDLVVTFKAWDLAKNRVLYFGDHLEVTFERNSRVETEQYYFAALVSAYPSPEQPLSSQITFNVTNTEEQHFLGSAIAFPSRSDIAVITVNPGYELQMSFDVYQIEECCDLLTLETALENQLSLNQRLSAGDFIAIPASTVQRTVTLTYQTDLSIAYNAFDLKFYGAECVCAAMQEVPLTSEYSNSNRTYRIISPNSENNRSYCSLQNCGYNVSVANDPSLLNCTIVLSVKGTLRAIPSDYLLIDYGTEKSYRLVEDFDYELRIPASWARIIFHTGTNLITNRRRPAYSKYSWEIAAGLLCGGTESSTERSLPPRVDTTYSSIPDSGPSGSSVSTNAGDKDGGGSSTIYLHTAAKLLFIFQVIRLAFLQNHF